MFQFLNHSRGFALDPKITVDAWRRMQNVQRQDRRVTEREMAENKAPDYFVCPIGSELMTDPVMTSNGFTYEKSAIERWFEENNTDPKTNLVLEDKTLTPNVQLHQAIQAYVAAKRLSE
jgi:hypothetical protein